LTLKKTCAYLFDTENWNLSYLTSVLFFVPYLTRPRAGSQCQARGPANFWALERGKAACVCSAGRAAMGGFEGLGDKGSLRRWLQREDVALQPRDLLASAAAVALVRGGCLLTRNSSTTLCFPLSASSSHLCSFVYFLAWNPVYRMFQVAPVYRWGCLPFLHLVVYARRVRQNVRQALWNMLVAWMLCLLASFSD
jgi:hypothetical protein